MLHSTLPSSLERGGVSVFLLQEEAAEPEGRNRLRRSLQMAQPGSGGGEAADGSATHTETKGKYVAGVGAVTQSIVVFQISYLMCA